MVERRGHAHEAISHEAADSQAEEVIMADPVLISRRRWLALVAAGACGSSAGLTATTQPTSSDSELRRRIRRLVDEFSEQGFHRTGTAVDNKSGEWLYEEVRRLGVVPTREPFPLSRVDPIEGSLMVGTRRLDGLPLFDAMFTDRTGIRGQFGPIESDAEIGLVDAPPNTAAAGAFGAARREGRHKALVCITRGAQPGLCPNNADAFLNPFGPPTLQVSSEHLEYLQDQARRASTVHLTAAVGRTPVSSFNVVATIPGRNRTQPPLVVMTPRSGWYACASERGGGLVCWLELMRELHREPAARDAIFVASSGHELGHLGINAFIANRADIAPRAAAWMHFGANVGAATRPDNTIQASDDEREAVLSQAMTAFDLRVSRRVPRGTVPAGEAEAVHRGGARYVSVLGSSTLFHHPADRGSATVDAEVLGRFTRALAMVARTLSAG
jgi:hypothetical protein